MRLVALHQDVLVFVSRVWQTTCTAVRAGGEGFVIDSPVYPDELETLPGVLAQAGFPVSALVATHADWDHLLGRTAFPGAALGLGDLSARRLQSEPGTPQRELREFDEEHYVESRPPLSLGQLQQFPVPGHLALGHEREIELHPATGHVEDGMALWLPWTGVLVCGDYLSPVELPTLSPSGSADAYAATLGRLSELVEQAEWIVPGHGAPMSQETARRICSEDRAYIDALRASDAAPTLPEGRRTAAQRKIHRENVEQVTASRRP
jgi:glyoxylase-like metal-dependent hydrolase (beta-lactamase superfamily II)